MKKTKLFIFLSLASLFAVFSLVVFSQVVSARYNNNRSNFSWSNSYISRYYMARSGVGFPGDNSYYCDTDYSDTAYCNNKYPSADCVFNHKCYNNRHAYDLNGDGRREAYCKDMGRARPTYNHRGITYYSSGTWINCDAFSGMCSACGNYKWTKAGESGVGEYSDTSTNECCGDDSGEYYITNYCPGYSGSGKCCNNRYDKIDANGNCVSSCSTNTNNRVNKTFYPRISYPFHRHVFWFRGF